MENNELTTAALQGMKIKELSDIAQGLGIADISGVKKLNLVYKIMETRARQEGKIYTRGVLQVMEDGFGFLRSEDHNFIASPDDIYISSSQIKRFGLRTGHIVSGLIRPPKDNEKYFALLRVDAVNMLDPETVRTKRHFDNLTPSYPQSRIQLETDNKNISMRIIDLLCPLGKGQRGLIVAQPKTGKTTLIQQIANSITTNHPEIILTVLLIDERPEEVTEMQNAVKADVVSSTFDESAERHVEVAQMTLEKAKRLVELGFHVVILLDSLTRLARAYNAIMPHSGKILSGGIDANALQRPKRYFGSARAIENGGSLTLIATALVDTGSRIDDVIFEEFKGTGNMELTLDRRLSDRRIYPSIDVNRSSTRKEEMLLSQAELARIWILRKLLNEMSPAEAMEFLIERMERTKSNREFLKSMNQ